MAKWHVRKGENELPVGEKKDQFVAARGILWGCRGLSVAGEGAGWVLHSKYFTMCEPSTSSQGSHPWGRSCWSWPPPVLAFLHGFQESTLGCTKPPSPELNCSSLVTLLLNNLQNGALPVFIREAFQVCEADFMPSWCSCRGGASSPCPAVGVTSTSSAGKETAHSRVEEPEGE